MKKTNIIIVSLFAFLTLTVPVLAQSSYSVPLATPYMAWLNADASNQSSFVGLFGGSGVILGGINNGSNVLSGNGYAGTNTSIATGSAGAGASSTTGGNGASVTVAGGGSGSGASGLGGNGGTVNIGVGGSGNTGGNGGTINLGLGGTGFSTPGAPGTVNAGNINAASLSGNGAGVTSLSAGSITPGGTLPALNGSALTSLSAGNLTPGGTLPALNAAAVTNYFQTNLINDTTIDSIADNSSPPSPSGAWAYYPMDAYCTNFLLTGALTPLTQQYPGSPYYYGAVTQSGTTPNVERNSCQSLSFGFDGNTLILRLLGQGQQIGIAVDGVMNPVWFNETDNTGNEHWVTITFATANRKTIQLLNPFGSGGVYVPITNGFYPNNQTQPHRMVILGDSFTEQAYTLGSQAIGPISQLQAMRPDLNIFGLGEGGTGWVNPYTGSGRTNFVGRVNDVVACNPETILIWAGVNDCGYTTGTSVTQPVYTNATNVLIQLRLRLPNAQITVCGPQWPRTPSPVGDLIVFQTAICLSNACVAVGGVNYVSPLTLPWITGSASTPNSGNADQYTSMTDFTHPSLPAGAIFYANMLNGVIVTNTTALYPSDMRPVSLTNGANVVNGTFTGSFNGPTNGTAPGNTTTIQAWVNFTNSGQVFKLPLYQ